MLKTEDLIEGNIYYDCGFIFRYIKLDPNEKYNGNVAIYPPNKQSYIKKLAKIKSGNNNPQREATSGEIEHLEICEMVGKYVEYDYSYWKDTITIPEIDEILKESIKTNNLNL